MIAKIRILYGSQRVSEPQYKLHILVFLMFPKNWTDLTWNQYNIHVWMHGRDSGRQSLNLSRCAQIGSRQFGELFWILLLNAFLTITDQIFGCVSQIFLNLSQYLFFC
ncbi:Hypothetical_protein [Hexamita inflata]|uniref:Hypothetical_protein n=1 Tax=Hexamita inflata TaxID=28002 RepID=A0AA86Q6C9_9EUKA|nr:Hypothetical protein HINF_LOCUS40656 [Hexamita inflata]